MDASFTHEEMRFVLAEMIKSSRVDLESLAFFIKSHGIEPDWMSMQLPLGRNMNQCVQVAEHLSIPSTAIKRKTISAQDEHVAKRRALSDQPEQTVSASSNTAQHHPAAPSSSHVAILPRPANGFHASLASQPQVTAPRKRGRPSRADKAKRDLRPNLPPQLAPKPTQSPVQGMPRAILPAANVAIDSRRLTPPAAYSASPGPHQGISGKKRMQPSPGERSRPASNNLGCLWQGVSDKKMQRVLVDGTLDDVTKEERQLQRPEPVLLEPGSRRTNLPQNPLEGSPAALPPVSRKAASATSEATPH